MLLREGSRREGTIANLDAVTRSDADVGLMHGMQLAALVEATVANDGVGLERACRDALVAMRADAVRDALLVAAAFNGITRVADATGIPLDPPTREATVALRPTVGIDAFDYAAKSARYD